MEIWFSYAFCLEHSRHLIVHPSLKLYKRESSSSLFGTFVCVNRKSSKNWYWQILCEIFVSFSSDRIMNIISIYRECLQSTIITIPSIGLPWKIDFNEFLEHLPRRWVYFNIVKLKDYIVIQLEKNESLNYRL